MLAKAKHSPRSFPPFLLGLCNIFLLHRKRCRAVCVQPPTSPKCFAVNEAGNLKRSMCNLEIQSCITEQVNNQGTLRLSVQSQSHCVRLLAAYLSSLIVSRAAGEPMPCNGNCHSTSRPVQGYSRCPPCLTGACGVQAHRSPWLLGWVHHFVALWERCSSLCSSLSLRCPPAPRIPPRCRQSLPSYGLSRQLFGAAPHLQPEK